MAFSSAGKGLQALWQQVELRAYGEPVFFVVSKREAPAQWWWHFCPPSRFPSLCNGKIQFFIGLLLIFLYCRMYLPWPSCYSQAHTLMVKFKF